jgi:hypothetical protein
MAKKPKLKHDYHASKDRLKISIQGYALKNKKTRDDLMKKIRDELEQSPARRINDAKTKANKGTVKKQRGQQKDVKLIESGD